MPDATPTPAPVTVEQLDAARRAALRAVRAVTWAGLDFTLAACERACGDLTRGDRGDAAHRQLTEIIEARDALRVALSPAVLAAFDTARARAGWHDRPADLLPDLGDAATFHEAALWCVGGLVDQLVEDKTPRPPAWALRLMSPQAADWEESEGGDAAAWEKRFEELAKQYTSGGVNWEAFEVGIRREAAQALAALGNPHVEGPVAGRGAGGADLSAQFSERFRGVADDLAAAIRSADSASALCLWLKGSAIKAARLTMELLLADPSPRWNDLRGRFDLLRKPANDETAWAGWRHAIQWMADLYPADVRSDAGKSDATFPLGGADRVNLDQLRLWAQNTVDGCRLLARLTAEREAPDARPAGGDALPGTRRKERLTLAAKALALLVDHPDWTNAQITEALGCHPKSIYRWPSFRAARKAMASGKDELPRGRKTRDRDGKGYNLDAWDPDEEPQ